MAHLKNKTIRELNEKDLYDRLKQIRTELFKLNVESKKGTLRKESGKLKPLRKDIARMLTRVNELKKKMTSLKNLKPTRKNLLVSKRSYNGLDMKI